MKANPRYYAKQLVAACVEEPKRVSDIVTNFWRQVLAEKRFGWRKRILQEVESVWHELTSRDQVCITSHRLLSGTEQQLVARDLQKKFGKNIDLTWEIKPHILGGLVITINNEKFDHSVKGKLDSIYYNLVR